MDFNDSCRSQVLMQIVEMKQERGSAPGLSWISRKFKLTKWLRSAAVPSCSCNLNVESGLKPTNHISLRPTSHSLPNTKYRS